MGPIHYITQYISQGKWFIAVGGIGMVIYVRNYVYTQYQIDKAPRRAFERGHVPAITKDHAAPFIPRDKEVSNLSKFIQESTIHGKYVVMLGEVFTSGIHCHYHIYLIIAWLWENHIN
jgi:hypothetical protein